MDTQKKHFPVVCVGGSADGPDAYTRLLRHLPDDMGVAIVIVNHLRVVATLLHELLPRCMTMPVKLSTDGLVIEPNAVFIIPAQRDLHVRNGAFRLKPIPKPRGWPDVITAFMQPLTRHWNGELIAVIVSGYDGDGAAALCGIRDAGGTTIAQTPETAAHPTCWSARLRAGASTSFWRRRISHGRAQGSRTAGRGDPERRQSRWNQPHRCAIEVSMRGMNGA